MSEVIKALAQKNEPNYEVFRELVRDPLFLDDNFTVEEALREGVKKGFSSCVRILLEAGASPNTSTNTVDGRGTDLLNLVDSRGTVLHIAAQSPNSTEIILDLIKHGADVNAVNVQRRTPLHEASFFKCVENTQVLLQNGAIVDAVNEKGETPLYLATEFSLSSRLESYIYAWLFLPASSPVNYEVGINLPQFIRLLLRHKADANVKNNNGDTPLHCTADMDEPRESIRELLKGGARLDSLNNQGHSPLYRAVALCNVEATQEYLRCGASCDIVSCLEALEISASERRRLDDITKVAQELIRYALIKNSDSLESIHQQLKQEKVGNTLRNISSLECNLEDFQQACFSEVEALSKLNCDCGKSSIWGSISNWEDCNCDTHYAIFKFLFSGRKSNFTDAFFYKLDEQLILDATLTFISYFAFKETQKRLILPWPCLKEIERYVSFEDSLLFLQSKQADMDASEFEKYQAFLKGESSAKSSSEINPPGPKRLRVS